MYIDLYNIQHPFSTKTRYYFNFNTMGIKRNFLDIIKAICHKVIAKLYSVVRNLSLYFKIRH